MSYYIQFPNRSWCLKVINYSQKKKNQTYYQKKLIGSYGLVIFLESEFLTHFSPMSHFYTPWKRFQEV